MFLFNFPRVFFFFFGHGDACACDMLGVQMDLDDFVSSWGEDGPVCFRARICV